ncbi:serine hydrolase [Bacteroidota bacterium]
MSKKSFLTGLFLLFSFCLEGYAQDDLRDRIDGFVTQFYEKGLFNGSVLIAVDGNVVYKNALGFADFETGQQLETNSAFYLASVSKQLTCLAVMILKEQDKLNYNDKLSDFFPEFPPYADTVTVKHLMTHTSGIPDHFRLGSYKPDLTNNDVLNLLVKQDTLDFEPGERYSYSNGAYVLLSMIVEKASGVPFHEFMEENVFDPLDMDNSLVYDESKPEILNRATGFNMYGEKDDYDILTTGAGGIYSTVVDLYKLDRALYSEKLVTQETLDEAFTSFELNDGSKTNYGYGWGIREEDDGKIVAHSGGLNGFRTYFERHLDKKNTIALLTNKGDVFPLGAFRDGLNNILNNELYEIPKTPISMKVHELINESSVDAAIEEYAKLKENYFDDYDFSENQLNSLGYYLLGKNRVNSAVEILKLNVREFPDAYNTYDSLGEAYMIKTEYELAIKNYKKSLELNSDNANAVEMLKRIEKLKKGIYD